MTYTLCCIVFGESHPFPVDINETLTVGHLKKLIKEERPSLVDDATRLTLYQVEIKLSDDGAYIEEVNEQSMSDVNKLNPWHELSDAFQSPGPLKGNIHIIIRLPGESIDP